MKVDFRIRHNYIFLSAFLFLDPGGQPLLCGNLVNSFSSVPRTFSVPFTCISLPDVLVIDELDILTLPDCLLLPVLLIELVLELYINIKFNRQRNRILYYTILN